MRRAGYAGAFWPTPLQEGLLRTALLRGDNAAEAWAGLRPELDLDDIWDPEVHRILPLIHRALIDLGIDDPDLPRLKGVARRTWYENQVLLNGVAPVIALLEDAGIPTMLLKGMPIALAYHRDLSLRPMRDVDVLIPTAERDRARRVLAAHGWRVSREGPSLSHGEGIVHADGRSIDLHWHLGMPFVIPHDEEGSDADFWRAAEPLTAAGVATRALCPTDTLLHVCVHGAWSGSYSTVRWVADAACVLREAGDRIDWQRLVEQIARRRLVLLMRDPLRYLAEVFDAPVPDEVIRRISAMPTTPRERATYRRITQDVGPRRLVGGLPMTVAQWTYVSAKWSRARAIRQLPLFMRDHWGLASAGQLPAEALRKVAVRAGRIRRGTAAGEP